MGNERREQPTGEVDKLMERGKWSIAAGSIGVVGSGG